MEVERRARDSAPARYRPRRPSQSVLYRCVQEHFETWLAQRRDGHDDDGAMRDTSIGNGSPSFIPRGVPLTTRS